MRPPVPNLSVDDAPQAARSIENLLVQRLGPKSGRWQARLVSRSDTHGGSLLFAVSSVDAGRKLAAKLYRNAQGAAIEYQVSQEAPGREAAVARALFCDVERGLVVSEWVEGPTLAAMIARGKGEDGLIQAGRWLRRFHRRRQLRPTVYRPLGFLVGLCDAAAALPGTMPAGDRTLFRAAVQAVAQRAARSLPGLTCPVRLHGDFNPRNLILSPDGPVAVDTPASRVGSRHDDLTRMTVQLALTTDLGSAGGALDSERAREVFLSAYGLTGRQARARLALSEAVDLLKRWQIEARGSRPNPAKVRTIQAVLARRGWLLALVATLAEVDIQPERRPRAGLATTAAATS